MAEMAFSIQDDGTIRAARAALSAVGSRRLGAWVRWAVGEESDEFVSYVRTNWLSGQAMNVVTGETRDHVGAYFQKTSGRRRLQTWVIRPGVGIPGTQNYLEKWVGTRLEFMRPAFEAFGSENRIRRAVETNIGLMLDRVEKER